jgi:A/G-specific adenine glycosylase
MTEVPTTQWTRDFDADGAERHAPRLGRLRPKWRRLPGSVRHVFTHFPLELVVYRAEVPIGASAPAGTRWIAAAELDGEALPSVMRKVVVHAIGDPGRPAGDAAATVCPPRVPPRVIKTSNQKS